MVGSIFLLMHAAAQAPSIPRPFNPKSEADYRKVQDQAVNGMIWFLQTPAAVDPEYYQLMYSFLFKWVAGNQDLKLVIEPKIAAPILDEKNEKNNPDILMAYLAGMALYKIQHPSDTDQAAIQLEGLRAVLKECENNPDFMGKSKAAIEYGRIRDEGNLDGWVKENLTVQ